MAWHPAPPSRPATTRAPAIAVVLGLLLAACGGGPASGTGAAGDLPDTQAFVAFTPPNGGFTVKVPEGWARTEAAGAVTFSDKFNSLRVETAAVAAAPTVQSVEVDDVAALWAASTNFQPGKASAVSRAGGPAVLLTYQADGPPDPVTAKVVRLAVERYAFWKDGREVILTLSSPVGSDNVDPWRTVTDSFRWA